jgi:RNA polymerase sigma-70 factor (ECF subfamily)
MDEDKKLIKRTINGEKNAFETIIKKYQKPLFNYIRRMVGEQELAMDFTQEVFLKTYSSLHTYQSSYKFSTWLFKIASNYLIDYWRKKKLDTFSIDQKHKNDSYNLTFQVPDNESSISKKFELNEMKAKIEQVLEKIPASLRELFIWRHINELSYQEIAEIKDLPEGTIKNRIFQAKERVRNLLGEFK